MNESSKQSMLISKGWLQAVALVMLFGFFVMGLLAYYTYTDEPPIPAQVVDANGRVLFTGKDIIAGQEIFLKNGLMEYGSIFGHGAWLGPDYTADYLHRAAELTTDFYGGSASGVARQQTITDFKTNRYDPATGVLPISAAQADAFQKMTAYYADYFGAPTTKYGLRPSAITDPEQIRRLTAFFSWSAWAGSTLRPHKNYSYTNNWPPESLVANYASADTMLWSVLSLIALLGGIGLLLAAFFLINLPIVSYYEIGTALTANHAHAAMMGVYGMLAVGLALFCLRYLIPEKLWSDRAAKISFWSLNLGLAWMVFATLFPLGLIQLYHSLNVSYFDARSLKFISGHTLSMLEWMRLPGDAVFILGGTLPVLYLCWLGVRRLKKQPPREEPDGILFTEIQESQKFGGE
jgi:nitric oxide reductase subunit B